MRKVKTVLLTVIARTTYYGREGTHHYGELRQGNGSWVVFDPNDPANKILDRELLPDVERYWTKAIGLGAIEHTMREMVIFMQGDNEGGRSV